MSAFIAITQCGIKCPCPHSVRPLIPTCPHVTILYTYANICTYGILVCAQTADGKFANNYVRWHLSAYVCACVCSVCVCECHNSCDTVAQMAIHAVRHRRAHCGHSSHVPPNWAAMSGVTLCCIIVQTIDSVRQIYSVHIYFGGSCNMLFAASDNILYCISAAGRQTENIEHINNTGVIIRFNCGRNGNSFRPPVA